MTWALVTIKFPIIKEAQKQNFKILVVVVLDLCAEEMSKVAKFTAKYIFSCVT